MSQPPGTPVGEPESPRGPWPGPRPPGGYGTPPPPYPPGFLPPPPRRANGLGTASLLVGLVALLATLSIFGGVILGVTAVVLGLVARRRVKRGEATGAGAALIGIVLGVIAVAAGAFIIWLAFGTEVFNEDYQHCLGERNGHAEFCQQYR